MGLADYYGASYEIKKSFRDRFYATKEWESDWSDILTIKLLDSIMNIYSPTPKITLYPYLHAFNHVYDTRSPSPIFN